MLKRLAIIAAGLQWPWVQYGWEPPAAPPFGYTVWWAACLTGPHVQCWPGCYDMGMDVVWRVRYDGYDANETCDLRDAAEWQRRLP